MSLFQHEKETEEIVRKMPPKPKRKPATSTYDPFKLVPCLRFTDDFPVSTYPRTEDFLLNANQQSCEQFIPGQTQVSATGIHNILSSVCSCMLLTLLLQAPFDIEVDVSAMMVLDTHAHLCKTEVIGLLGGHYDIKSSLLKILRAEPCDSISTGMQCEMDPGERLDPT